MRVSSITKNAGKACNNRLYRHIRTFEKIIKNYFVIYKKTQKIHKLSVSLHNLSIPSEYVNFYWSFCQFSVLPVCAICAIKKTPELSPEFFHSSFFCGSSTRRVNHSFSQCRVTVPPWVSAAARTLFRS